jgi:hypothetical protein
LWWPTATLLGGKSWFVRGCDPAGLQPILDEALVAYDVRFDPSPTVTGGNLTYLHKVDGDRQIYFFANSSQTLVETQVCLRGRLDLELWNPHDGQRSASLPIHE